MKISNLKDRTDLGTIIAFAGHNLPEGYLECNGTQYNITDQLPLFLTIGLTYGGNLTGLPANLDWMTTDTVTVISKSANSIILRLHRERGLLGLPTIATSTGISVNLGGDSGSSTGYDREDMNTGVITVNNIFGTGWEASSWYASMPSSGTYSASNFVTFVNSGATISNTGFAGTFNVPNLNNGQVIAAGSSNTISSNIGTRKLKDFGTGVGFDTEYKRNDENKLSSEILKKSLSKKFSPEFLNRVDEIVIFNSLEKEDLKKIIELELKTLVDRTRELGYDIKITAKALSFLCDKGYDKKYGARPLKRAIQKYVEDLLAEEIVKEKLKTGDEIKIDWDGKSENLATNKK